MPSVREVLVKRAQEIIQKNAFQPMPGGQPPADPAAQGGAPMDPAMAGGAGAPPMDPSMMGGGAGMPPMDPSMMGMPPGMAMGSPPPATVGQLSITDFQTIMMDMLSQVLGGGAPADAGAGAPPPEVAPQGDKRTVSNTEISEKLDALIGLLSGAGAGPESMGAMPPEAAGGAMPPAAAPGPEMGFGGQATGGAGAAPMEIQASEKPSKRNSLADVILKKTAQARKA